MFGLFLCFCLFDKSIILQAVGSAAVAYPKPKATSQKQVHIFVCTDEYDLRPLAVLINSTISNAM
jgi:hypothetical protein